jgi:TetR/AcrR family transcriptional regulator
MASRSKKSLPVHRDRRASPSRAAILKAAERIFADVGLAGARTEAIAAAAGVNKALLYYYFKGKEALYFAVLEEQLEQFHRSALAALSEGGNARSTILRYVSTHFDFISARPYYPRLLQRLLVAGGRPLERLAERHFRPLHQKLVQVIERGIRSGELRRVDSGHAVLSLVGLTVFYFSAAPVLKALRNIDPYQKAQLAERKQEVLKFIRYGLFRHPEGHFS